MEPLPLRRLDLGWFVRPGTETADGRPRVEPAFGYLVRHGGELVLFDTGIGTADAATDAHYRPRRRPLRAALAAAGAAPEDIALVVNCHLHFDHVGGNPLFPGTPILAQSAELDLVRAGGHTFEELVAFPGARYEELAGEAEVRPGLWIVPTPGHTAGHQSLVVRRPDGTVVLAGQTHASASDFAAARLAETARAEGAVPPLPEPDAWPARLLAFDPRRVLFAHDASVWEPAG
ncbi:MBL fold metallo-hydrolase [Actinacidiphila guanduensis]|uniref:Metallo-beta-lactamase superfamily protein n=1 Tax=Actinacidiphila guanduensis TaxID=310781 RepID=A0A1H0GN22_9ACTN|nr:MBL fold metallo-hydrolase [Actinacidiphila guanduensis]SDO08139.1 Metallo-beta-lactamase superfamily protein [Actinacidiphila guanduensis]